MTQPELYRFSNRSEAGRLLASALTAYANRSEVIVLALPRGGVPVAFEIARVLSAPMGVCIVRKLGVPGHQELAMGAIASGGVQVLNTDLLNRLDIPQEQINQVIQQEQRELSRREQLYQPISSSSKLDSSGSSSSSSHHPTQDLPFADSQPTPSEDAEEVALPTSFSATHRVVIVVDDGVATGSTLKAAILCLKQQCPNKIIVAVPVASPMAYQALKREVDEVVCLMTPSNLSAIGNWYDDFTQVSDEEVRELLTTALSGKT